MLADRARVCKDSGSGVPYNAVALSDDELKASLYSAGQLMPVFRFRGDILDGARRVRLLAELGKRPKVLAFRFLEQAAAALWQTEPLRAHERFAASQMLSDAARLFRVDPSEVAKLRQALKAKVNGARPRPARKLWRRKCERVERYLAAVQHGATPLTVDGLRLALEGPSR